MVRTSLVSLAICLVLATTAIAQEKTTSGAKKDQSSTAWFDLENCPICKCMTAQKGLMESMKWETHLIDNGMISIATIPDDKKEAMAKCKKEMQVAIDKAKSGEKMDLCGFCKSYGGLVAAGAKVQEIETATGMVSLITSDKPEVIKKIQEHANTTIREYTAMLDAEKKVTK